MSTKIKSRRFYLVQLFGAIAISILLSTCRGQPATSTAEPGPTSKEPTVRVIPEAKEVQVISTDNITQNFCGKGSSASYEITRSRTITHTVTLSESISVSASGQAGIPGVGNVQVGTVIASTYGLAYGEADTLTRRQSVTTEAGTNANYEFDLFEVWETGTIIISDVNKEVGRYHYKLRTDFGIDLKEPKFLDCPPSPPTPTSTAPPPTATAVTDGYSGTWYSSRNTSAVLPFALYWLEIEIVNPEEGTATFTACRCAQKDRCRDKFKLTPEQASARYDGIKLVSDAVYIDEQRTFYWKLAAIRDGQSLRVTVEQYDSEQKVAGPEDFVLSLPGPLHVGQLVDDCRPAPEVYLGP